MHRGQQNKQLVFLETTGFEMGAKRGLIILLCALEPLVIFFIFLPFSFESIGTVTVVAASLAVISYVEARVHLGQGVHA